MGITVVSSLILLAIIGMILYLYGANDSEKKVINGLRAFGFFLIFLQTIIIFLRIPITYANEVTTIKVVMLAIGYLLVALSFLFEVLSLRKNSKPMKRKKSGKK